MHPLYIALTAIDVIAVVSALGLLATWIWVLPSDQDPLFHRAFWRRGVGLAFLMLIVSSILILVSRSLEMSGGPVSGLPQVIPEVLEATRFGSIWWFRPPLLLVFGLFWLWGYGSPERARRVGILLFIAIAALAFTRSETGHPADHGSFRFAVFVDWFHLIAAGLWVGALFAMTLVVFPVLRKKLSEGRPDLPADIFQRLSNLAGWALVLILATGIWTAVGQLGSWHALFHSSYGEILLVKLALVLVLILIGAHNRFVRLPRIRVAHGLAPRWNRWVPTWAQRSQVPGDAASCRAELDRCYHLVGIESLIGVGVLIAASVLLHGMPPAAMAQVPPGFGTLSMSGGGSGFVAPPPAPPASSPRAASSPAADPPMHMKPARVHFSFGEPGRTSQVTETIHIRALDTMRFSPSRVHVAPGATVRFVVTDAGHLEHEFVIGNAREQAEHEREMEAHPNMPMHDPNGVSLKPGETRSIIWHFPDRAMVLEYACHEPGHFAAGMVGRIVVGHPGSDSKVDASQPGRTGSRGG